MSDLNKTPTANRLHIAFFGIRNAGKSSLINAITNQNIAITSDIPGTTTDPVYKSMEILPIGPVVLIDTAGIDDVGQLGIERVKKSYEVLSKTDLAILVISTIDGITNYDKNLIEKFKENNTEFIIAINKIDVTPPSLELIRYLNDSGYKYVLVSAKNNDGILELKKLIIKHSPKSFEQPTIVGDLIKAGDIVVLVIPIDTGMPKGRLILPQVQTLRDILDSDAIAYVVKERELKWALSNLKQKPKLVITDSQAFLKVSADVPHDILLTSFSILFARYKGDLFKFVKAAKTLKNLQANDKVLIAEACTHHTQPDDIGKVKLPRWIRQHINENIIFDFCQGRDYPNNIKDYKLIIHCGGCMINRKEMLNRIEVAEFNDVPIINYGIAIATLHGILDRALKPFQEVWEDWINNV